MQHIVICGYSRAGTTLFYNMLHTTVSNHHMLSRESHAAWIIGRHPSAWITKRPLDIFEIDAIRAANAYGKRLHVILMVRDPRSLVVSRHQSVPDDYFIGWDRQYFVDGGRIERTNPGIVQIHNAIARTQARGDLDSVRILRFEDLVADPEGVQAELGRELGLEYRGRFSDFHRADVPEDLRRALNGLRPVDPTALTRWRQPEHRERVLEQFSACPALFDLLEQYGYESDRRWWEALQAGSVTDYSMLKLTTTVM
ncbi:MAG TPA: hypothetical protein ENK10_06130 [Acidobacteria bacterium]|nr:hypothetical protein [Acidobacteriota bacterium]